MPTTTELIADSPEAVGVQVPWHRTVYAEADSTGNDTGGIGTLARQVRDTTIGLQVDALNSSVQMVTQGVKATMDTAGSLARAVPGAGLVADLAQRIGENADVAATGAKSIAVDAAREGSAGHPHAAAADLGNMLFGPAAAIAALPVSSAVDIVKILADTRPAESVRNLIARAVNGALDALSVSGGRTVLDTFRIRESFLAMTTGPGKATVSDVVDLGTGLLRFAMGDTRSLANAVETGILNANYGVQYGNHGVLYPQTPIGSVLYDVLQLLVKYQPATLVSALGSNDYWNVFNAAIEDSEGAVAFAGLHPTALALQFLGIVRFFSIGIRDCTSVEAYIRAEHELVLQHPDLQDPKIIDQLSALPAAEAIKHDSVASLAAFWKTRPFTCTLFEFYAGLAKSRSNPQDVAAGILNHADFPESVFPQPVLDLAQDTAFWYSTAVLGREQALLRMHRLFGRRIRERLEADPTLETDAGLDAARAQALANKLKADPAEADRVRELAEQKIRSLQELINDPNTYVPAQVHDRLAFYVALRETLVKAR